MTNPDWPVAVILCSLLITIAICAIVWIADRLNPAPIPRLPVRRTDPFTDYPQVTDPDWVARLEISHDGLPVAGGLLELQPVLPPDVTGELPMIQCELGEPVGAYLDRLFGHDAEPAS